MANLTQQSFTDLVRNMVTAIQGTASALVDISVGSILRTVVEANAAVILWLQGLILQLLAVTRAATSSGADLDSWCADYGFTRLPASYASGSVTFARFTASQQAVVPVGATIQTADGSQSYTVTADAANPAYSPSAGGYVMSAGTGSVSVPVIAQASGAAANAQIGTINTITQAMPGVDTVTNAAAFTNGADAESDSAFRARFVAYIASLSKATKNAIGYAITALQQNVAYVLVENQSYAGAAQLGYFYVVVDDGTGTPSAGFLSSVNNAIDAVRPFTSTFGVYAPVVVTAAVGMTCTIASGYDAAATKAAVQAALTNYINSLAIGQTLTYSRLAQLAYDASPGVTNVTSVTLNAGTADLTATNHQIIKAGTITVS